MILRPAALSSGLVAALLVLGGCTQSSSAGGRTGSDQGYVSGDGTTTILAAGDRRAAPELRGTTVAGGTFDLAAQRGKVVVVNVWASWCAPCRDEAGVLAEVSKQLRTSGVQFVGINTRDSDAAAQTFVRKHGITYPNLRDPDGKLLLGFAGTLPPSAIPSTLVIDAAGRVAARAVGQVDRSRLLGLIEPVLADPRTASAASSNR